MPNNKKNKRNNKKTARRHSSVTSAQKQCLHGCSDKEFIDRHEYRNVVDDFLRESVNHLIPIKGGKGFDQLEAWDTQFVKKHERFFLDPAFCRYVFARSTNSYIESGNSTFVVKILLFLALTIRYHYIPASEGKDVSPGSELHSKFERYQRGVLTERNTINCLARETPCNCMKEKKTEAKTMEKLEYCHVCSKEHPRETIFLCSGCQRTRYCSKHCQRRDWPRHRLVCKEI